MLPDSHHEIGTVLAGKYRLTDLIARGGMGLVYRAEQLTSKRVVAIKVLLPVALEDEAHRQRFEREIKTVHRLEHPNIVGLLDYGPVSYTHLRAHET